jgi:osomolarity two-component system sensor histidine kinase SLN1
MRVAIREQLAALVLFAVLVALAIISIPTWIYVDNFVIGVESNSLALTASLKAARIASEIELIQTTCQTVSTRILIQQAFQTFYNSNGSSNPSIWSEAQNDLQSAFSGSGLLQARLFSRNSTGPSTGLLNVTGTAIVNLTLPYRDPAGNQVNLGDELYGYPPTLYPNITYTDQGTKNQYVNTTESFSAEAFPDVKLIANGGLLLGPLVVNETYALISLTVPVKSLQIANYILGYMTIVASAASLIEVQTSPEGLGHSGVCLIIGPASRSNRFNGSDPASNSSYYPQNGALTTFDQLNVHFVLPPQLPASGTDRHAAHSNASSDATNPFPIRQYPAVLTTFSTDVNTVNNASGTLTTTNEQGESVAVGVARPQTTLMDWAVVVEQDRSEAYTPIITLRNILVGTVFGTIGLVLVLIFPCAHVSVLPIRRLKSATEKSIAVPGYEDGLDDEGFDDATPDATPGSGGLFDGSEKGLMASLMRFTKRKRHLSTTSDTDRGSTRRIFKIPGKVSVRRHCITDELTELTDTFNAMSDELVKQYTSLDEKVADRTRELEISKKAAEAANESKTLFIANISHELKTPLNGIMGMCAVCMEEDDITRIKQSLKTLYKSGDLLLHLLEDLLSFSKNQIGQQISLEEKEFRLSDIRSQVLSIFDKQVRENKITLAANFVALESMEFNYSPERTSMETKLPALGPPGIGRLKDMCLWGDQHRILQVIINLVSNSLKFTPAGGKVDLRIRCIGEVEQQPSDESRSSSFSQKGSARTGRARHRIGSSSAHSASSAPSQSNAGRSAGGTALAINPLDPKATPHVHIRERSPTPPPPNARSFWFEFEVEDTGPGIPEHMQQKIFEPFVQGDLGLSKKFGGTGLGLSICSQLATIMGGHNLHDADTAEICQGEVSFLPFLVWLFS